MFTLGKRPLVRRRGRGGMQFRAPTIGKLKPAKYPVFELAENVKGEIIDLVHEKGRDVPLAKVRFNDGSISFLPAVIGSKIGSKIQFGLEAEITDGNVTSIQNIPDGTVVCNIEKQFGDGGSFIKSAGTDATCVFTWRRWCHTKTCLWKIYYFKSKKSSNDRNFGRRW